MRTWKRVTALGALCLIAALLPAGSPAGARASTTVIVIGRDGTQGAAAAVLAQRGRVTSELTFIDGVVAHVSQGRMPYLRADNRVSSITPDRVLEVQSDSFSDEAQSMFSDSVNAEDLWEQGIDGSGVGVALVDTGVAEHPDLGDRVVALADLTTDGTFTDHYGHGTFMAGIVAGDGASSAGRYPGVAPGAHLMSIKVAGADGTTTLGQVLYGLQLVDASKDRYGIRVVSLALSGPAVSGPDPLVLALERLWADGIVVVAAAGNGGPTTGTIGSPAVDPYSITVGATDEHGTASTDDDTVADWSARGPSVYGMPKPEVVAPGTSIVSLRVPGSSIDTTYPEARISDAYFRGSGTSMSAAVTAGVVALVLQAEPSLTPNEVKGRLMGGAQPLAGSDLNSAGRGSVDAAAAATIDAPAANADLPPLPSGRADSPRDPFGKKKQSFDWYDSPVGGDRWLHKAWAKHAWDGDVWVGRGWAGRGWAGADWSGRGWAESDWAGRGWAGRGWAGRGWADQDWSATNWAGKGWASAGWY